MEVITYLLALKCAYPNNIFMLRGNHEIRNTNCKYGFLEQIQKMYDQNLWHMFNVVFDYLPFAAVINKQYFAVHGGISQYLSSLDDIIQISRPTIGEEPSPQYSFLDYQKVRSQSLEMIQELLWSDPTDSTAEFVPSPRGNGICFGYVILKEFLEKENLKKIIRGHQCVKKGVEVKWNGVLLTIFSSSNYSAGLNNYAGVCKIDERNNVGAFSMTTKRVTSEVHQRSICIMPRIQQPKRVSLPNPIFRVGSYTPSILNAVW